MKIVHIICSLFLIITLMGCSDATIEKKVEATFDSKHTYPMVVSKMNQRAEDFYCPAVFLVTDTKTNVEYIVVIASGGGIAITPRIK